MEVNHGGPFQDLISNYKECYGKFHNPDLMYMYHIYVATCRSLASWKPHLTESNGFFFLYLEENLAKYEFGTKCLQKRQNI